MRTCKNCYNGHYNLSNRGEEMYCDESDYSEDIVSEEKSCDLHRFEPGYEEEKNYIIYDETYLGPGFFIVNKQGNEIVKYLKVFIMNKQGYPNYGLRAFSIHAKDNPDDEYNTIDFTFRDLEDDENGLYQVFTKLCINLNGETIETIDKFYQGRNHFSLNENSRVVTFSIAKDVNGVKDATDFIEINIGDDMTCRNYTAIAEFYNHLVNSQVKNATEKEIKQLLLTKLK